MKKMFLITRPSGKQLNLLSDKIMSKEKITLIEENEVVSNDEDTAQVLIPFFQKL